MQQYEEISIMLFAKVQPYKHVTFTQIQAKTMTFMQAHMTHTTKSIHKHIIIQQSMAFALH